MVFQDTVLPDHQQPQLDYKAAFKKLVVVATIAAAVQFGWALQILLLTPYTQLLGLKHKWVSFIWLCGPISGLIVQPIVGHHSDRCTSRFGRRRPFIVAGTALLSCSVLLIGFAADIGRIVGDSLGGEIKPRAIAIFVLGFWCFDIANNMIQSPCRALLADISGNSDSLITIGNALYSFFMTVGNISGFAVGAYAFLYQFLPFTITEACNQNCANLKTCFILSISITTSVVTLVVCCMKEDPLDPSVLEYWKEGCVEVGDVRSPSFFEQIVLAVKSTTTNIRILYAVTALNWIGVFPFLLYGTDWMGKEVYGGDTGKDLDKVMMYQDGVRASALGLMVYVLTMGAVSLFMEPLVRLFGNAKRVWSIGNLLLAFCMGSTTIISVMAGNARKAAFDADHGTPLASPPYGVKIYCVVLFAVLGIPQAVTYSIPFALASIYSKDGAPGQGLALGLLNLAIVIPQILMTMISGPLDALFGGSNLPAFTLGGIASVIGAIAAFKLPNAD